MRMFARKGLSYGRLPDRSVCNHFDLLGKVKLSILAKRRGLECGS